MITYDDENNSIVMEYLSPDGTRDKIEQSGPEQEVGEAAVPNFFPQPDNADTAILPSMLHHSSAESKMTSLDRVFEPSQKTGTNLPNHYFFIFHSQTKQQKLS